MSQIHQIYATHCTYGSSAIERRESGDAKDRVLGYSARSSSVPSSALRQHFRSIESFLYYYLPEDTPAKRKQRLTAETAPRRLFFLPSVSGLQVLGCISYRQLDCAGRVGSYFAHILTAQTDPSGGPWSALDCLRLWAAPEWKIADDPCFQYDIPPLNCLDDLCASSRTPAVVDEHVLWSFLNTPPSGKFFVPAADVIPRRWRAMPVERRRKTLRDALMAYLEIASETKTEPSASRGSLLFVIEPEMAVLLFFAITRLLPTTFRRTISFSTYETNPKHLVTRLAALTFDDPAVGDLRAEIYQRCYVIHTWRDRNSPLRNPQASYADFVLEKLLDVPETNASALTASLDAVLSGFEHKAVQTVEDLEAVVQSDRIARQILNPHQRLPDATWKRSGLQKAYVSQAIRKRLLSASDTAYLSRLAQASDHLEAILECVAEEEDCAPVIQCLVEQIQPLERVADFLSNHPDARRHKLRALVKYVENKRELPGSCTWLWEEPVSTRSGSENRPLLLDLLQTRAIDARLVRSSLGVVPPTGMNSLFCGIVLSLDGVSLDDKIELLNHIAERPGFDAAMVMDQLGPHPGPHSELLYRVLGDRGCRKSSGQEGTPSPGKQDRGLGGTLEGPPMTVEFLFLSGARQGEKHRLDGHRIVVGDVAHADVPLHSGDSAAAHGRHATLDCSEQAWTLSNWGVGEWLINQTPVPSGQSTRLRSGDIVRLSDEGPDFCFSIISTRESLPAAITSTPSASAFAALVSQVRMPEGARPPDPTDAATAEPLARVAGRRFSRIHPVASLLLGLAACLVIFAFLWSGRSNLPPTVGDDVATVNVGDSVTIPVLANDRDDGERLTIIGIDTTRTIGTPAIVSDGAVRYTAGDRFHDLQRGETRSDQFIYRVADDDGLESRATVRVTVVRPKDFNRPPVAVNDVQQVQAGATTRLTVVKNDSDPDGDELIIVRLDTTRTSGKVSLDADGTVQYAALGDLALLPQGRTVEDTFVYTVQDGHGGEAEATVAISVAGVKTQPTLEQFLQDHSPAIVWLGGEGKGLKIPLCTGFAVSPTKVVSTAREIAQLADFQQKGYRIFAHQASPTPTFIGVTNTALHPRYDLADPGSAASRLHNVGVAMLEHPLPKTLGLVTSGQIRSSIAGAKITVVGFAIPEGDDAKAYDRLNPPRVVQRTGAIRETRPLPGADDLPLLVLDLEVVAGMDGAPLILDDGKVLGLLLRSGETRYGILSDRIVTLIQ